MPSRNSVAMSVLSSRFCMSLWAWARSSGVDAWRRPRTDQQNDLTFVRDLGTDRYAAWRVKPGCSGREGASAARLPGPPA